MANGSLVDARCEARAYIDTLADVVRLRLEAGAHPEDAMLTGWTMLNAWVAVHVDGSAASVFKDGPQRVEVEEPTTCSRCGRDRHGYRGPLCRYCDGTAE